MTIRADHEYRFVGSDRFLDEERSMLAPVSVKEFRKSMISEICADDDSNVKPVEVEYEGD